MPVEFLTDVQAGAYGRFAGPPSRMQLERFFLLDDGDLGLVGRRRGDHSRLGFAVQLATVRFVGTFLADPGDVPGEVVDYVAAQLDIAAASMATYTQREKTRLEHQWEIAREVGYRDFVDAEAELAVWVDDRAWTTGEGAVAVFNGAVGWLRERQVLLPGVTTLARLVARERDAATLRVWAELASASAGQARLLHGLLVVPDGSRRSELDRMRKPETVTSGAGMVRALHRVSDVASLGLSGLDLSVVPHRRVVALARYGMAAKATALRRHPEPRRLATLVATVRSLEAKAVDDALELFDVLMTNDLLARAARESRNEKLGRYPRLSKDAGKLAAAVGVLLDALEHEEQLSLEVVWEEIESKVSRAELRAAVAHLLEVAPPADADPDGEWRTALIDRFASVRAFVPLLCETIEFGATAQAAGVLAAMTDLPGLLGARATSAVPAGYLDARRVADDVVPAGWWRRLVSSPIALTARSTGRPTCSASWSSFTAICCGATSTPARRRAGATRARSCSPGRHGTPLGRRRSTRSGCPRTRASCSLSTLKSSTGPGERSPTGSSPARRSTSTRTGGCTPTRSTRSPTRRASLICAAAWRACCPASIFPT